MPSANTCDSSFVTSHSCSTSGLTEGAEVVYISCTDDTESTPNADTASTNTQLSYTVDTTFPVLSTYQINPNPPNEDQDVVANVIVSDINLEKVLLELLEATGLVNHTVSTHTGDNYYYTVKKGNYTAHDTVTFYWYANDSAGNLAGGVQQTFIVANRIPSVSAPGIDKISPYTDDTISCNGGTFSDNDDEDSEQNREFRWYDGASLISGQNGQTLSLTVEGLDKGDSIKCEMRVYDGYDWSDLVSASNLATIQNSLPTPPLSLAISPQPVYVGDTLSAVASDSVDADRDPITYYYEFYNVENFQIVKPNSTVGTYVIQPSDFHKHIQIRSVANDGTVNSTVYAESITVGDKPPTNVTDISGFPANLYIGGTLIVSATGSTDPDGDPVEYIFMFYNVNDSMVRQNWGSLNQYTITASDVHDTIRVYSKGNNSWGSSKDDYYEDDVVDNIAPTLSVQNAPAADSIFNSPSVLLNCSGSIDADGDAVSYHYFGDNSVGVTYLGENNTKTNYNWTGLTDGTYYWKCLASDGRDNSSQTGIWNFTIDLSPPTVTLVSPANGIIIAVAGNSFNADFTDRGLANATLYILNSTGNLIFTATRTISGASTSVSIPFTLPYDDIYTWSYYSCDTLNNCNSSSSRTLTLDTTPPIFLEIIRGNIDMGQQINLKANISDKNGVASVRAEITYPDSTTTACDLVYNSGLWRCSSLALVLPGEYLVNYTATDIIGNKNSTEDWFEVYDRYDWEVSLSDFTTLPVSGANIVLSRPYTETVLLSNITDTNGNASFLVNKRFYDINSLISLDKFIVRNVDFTNPSNIPSLNFYRDNGQLTETIPLHRFNDISSFGIASNSSGLESNNVNIIFNYEPVFLSAPGKLEIVKCTNWNYTGRACLGSWEVLPSSRNISDMPIDRIITANSTGFGNNAYFLTENSCGTKGCEPGYGETSANCAADCKASSDGGGGGGGGGGGPSKPAPNISTIGGIKIGTSSIYEEMFPGDSKTESVSLTSTLSKPATATLAAEGEAASFLSFANATIGLNAAESKDFLVIISVPKNAVPDSYAGKIRVNIGNKSGEIAVNITVLSEGKLLDLKVDPLVSKIKPGNTLEVKVALINLGSSEVNGTFELQLIEAETGKTFVRSEEEFAVKTSEDFIRKLKIPYSAKDGQYFVKGIATYNNLGKELQATSLASVEVSSEAVSTTPYMLYIVLAISLILVAVIIVLIVRRLLKNKGKQPKQARKKEPKKQKEEEEESLVELKEESEETSLSDLKDHLDKEIKDLNSSIKILAKSDEDLKKIEKGLEIIRGLDKEGYQEVAIKKLFVEKGWSENLVSQIIVKSQLAELAKKVKSPSFGEKDAKEIRDKLREIKKRVK